MDQAPLCTANTAVKGDCSPRGLTTKVGSSLTKQMQEGCFPHHCCSLSTLLKSIHSLTLHHTASSTAFLLLLPRARPLHRGRRALKSHPLFFSQKIQSLLVCCLLNTGTSDEAPGCCRITACLSPRGRTPTCHSSSPLCRAMPRRLELTAYAVVDFLAKFCTQTSGLLISGRKPL